MRKKNILRLFLLTAFMALLWSCRNEDFAKGEKEPQRNNADFFKHSKKNGANARSGVDYISILEDYNRETDFLSKMPDQKGMPIWERMYSVETENASGLMIPLSFDDETMSSILFVTLDGKNTVTGVKDYDNTILRNVVYNQKFSIENREQFFLNFIFMDNRTFGNEHFTGIPKDLFVGRKFDNEYGLMVLKNFTTSSEVTTQQAGKLFIGQVCFVAHHCTHHGGAIGCDGCGECQTTTCTISVMGTADDPFPTTPGGGGGGPGGGGGCFDCGGDNPPTGPNVPTPCTSSGSTGPFYRPGPGQNCGDWPDIPDIDDPCEKTKNVLNKPEVQAKINALKVQAQLPAVNPNGGEKGFKVNTNGNVADASQTSKHEVNYGDLSGSYAAYHNHTLRGTHMLSHRDIDILLTLVKHNSVTGPSNAFHGMIAAEQDGNGGFIYLNYLIRFNGSYQEAVEHSFTDEKLDKIKVEYEKTSDKLLKESANSNDGGFTLNKEGLQKLFFEAVKLMELENKVILQRVDDDGVKTINLNNDGSTDVIPCPQF